MASWIRHRAAWYTWRAKGATMADRPETPAYQQIADDLRAQIRSGRYAVGDQLPPLSAFMARYSTSITVIRMALRELRGEGILRTRQGKGTFVLAIPDEEARPEHTAEFQTVMRHLGAIQEQMQRFEQRLVEVERQLADGEACDPPPAPSAR